MKTRNPEEFQKDNAHAERSKNAPIVYTVQTTQCILK